MANKYVATVESFSSYADGSGAPAIVVIGGHRFAANYLAGPKLHLLNASGRGPNESQVSIATAAYLDAVDKLGPDWLALNRAMYRA